MAENTKPTVKNYHISLREDGKWQVKAGKAEKALKLFEGNITIHKKDGKIRKQNY